MVIYFVANLSYLKVVKEVSCGGGAKQLVLNYHMGALGQVLFLLLLYFTFPIFKMIFFIITTWEHWDRCSITTSVFGIYPLHDIYGYAMYGFKCSNGHEFRCNGCVRTARTKNVVVFVSLIFKTN